MSGRCLIVTSAAPGGARWLRFAMLAGVYGAVGLEVWALRLVPAPPGAAGAAMFRAAARSGPRSDEGSDARPRPRIAFARIEDAPAAVAALDAAAPFDLIHLDAPEAPAWTAARRAALRLVDRPGDLAAAGALSDWAPHTDLFVAMTPEEAASCEDAGFAARAAPFLRSAERRNTVIRGRRARGATPAAGCWIGDDRATRDAALALFGEIRARGGGAPPKFIVAGPGAAAFEPPALPHPVLVLPNAVDPRAFHRGVDLSLFPDLGDGPARPRYDLADALEHGATPIASAAALTGLDAVWRGPRFHDLAAMAEYLFERGRELRDGGLAAELRARADWSWSGLQSAAAAERSALAGLIRARRRDRTPARAAG